MDNALITIFLRFCIILALLSNLACQTSSPSSADGIQPFIYRDHLKEIPDGVDDRQSNATYSYLLGEYFALDRDFVQAERYFQDAYKLEPNAFLGSKLIMTQIAVGNVEGALANVRKMALQYPKEVRLKLLLANILARQGQIEDAIENTLAVIKTDPKVEQAYEQLIGFYQSKNQVANAVGIAKKMTEAFPNSVSSWAALSRIYLAQGQNGKALPAAKRAFEINSSSSETILIYAYALELNKKSKEAFEIYGRMFRKPPTIEELVVRTYALYTTFGGLDVVLERLEKIIASDKESKRSAELQKVFILWEMKRDGEALLVLHTLHDKEPQSELVLYLLGMAHGREQDLSKALEYYQQIQPASVFYFLSQVNIVHLLNAKKDYRKALGVLNGILESDKVTDELFLLGASLYSQLNEFDQALKLIEVGMKRFPSKVQLRFMRGVYEERKGDIKACIKTMLEVIAVDPYHSSALNYLGYIYADRGEELEKAEELILRALLIKPNDGYYLDSLGWVYFKQKNLPKALETLLQAIKVVPQEGIVYEHIGDVYEAMQNRDEALQFYRKALENKIEPRDKPRLEDKIKSLEITET